MSRKCYLILPDNQSIIETPTPEFRWDDYPYAKSYSLKINKLVDWEYVPFMQFDSIVRHPLGQCGYTLPTPLDENELYSWSVTAFLEDGTQADLGTYYLAGPFNYKTHPANVGMDFTFNGPPSQEVLNNYLSRGANCMILDRRLGGGINRFEENLRMILYTGAKYIQRSACTECWDLKPNRDDDFARMKACIKIGHNYDPELIFEGGVYEWLTEDVSKTAIPSYVFEAFGLPVEERNFIVENMAYEDGHYFNFETKSGHPDISRLETQMWFFYRASLFINIGCESIHLGSTPCMTDVDAHTGYKGWKKVTTTIHEYARKHSRRGWILLNAHTADMKTPDDELIFDFFAWLILASIPEGEVAGPPTEEHPQRLEIVPGANPSAIYCKAPGGKHPCGYTVEHSPYVVEFDNYGIDWSVANEPQTKNGMYSWGFEDIAWFGRQPDWYRREFLEYAFNRIKEIDADCGHITMPMLRVGCYMPIRSNLPEFGYPAATGDEVAVRNIFIKDNK